MGRVSQIMVGESAGDAYMNHAGGGRYGTGDWRNVEKIRDNPDKVEQASVDEFQRGYDLGLRHGREKERERWRTNILEVIRMFANKEDAEW